VKDFIEELDRVEEFYLKNLDELMYQFKNIEAQRDRKDQRNSS